MRFVLLFGSHGIGTERIVSRVNFGNKSVVKFLGICLALAGAFAVLTAADFCASPASAAIETLTSVLTSTDIFLDQCRQQDELISDQEYESLIRFCRNKKIAETEAYFSRENFRLRLNEIELFTFWAIDGYLGDSVKIQTAQALLNGCENDLKNRGFWEIDSYLTGRCLYLRASALILEAYRLSQLPRFEDLFPLLEKARDFLNRAGSKDEILALHALGRVYADLAFAAETPESRYEDLMRKAAAAFEDALSLSSWQGGFMRTTLMVQLGNTLANLNEENGALDMLGKALKSVDPGDQPNRFLALHLDIAQVLTARYVETLKEEDLHAAEEASDKALLISHSLMPGHIVPHVRFNLAMTLFTIAQEKGDPDRNAQAIHEMEKVMDIWTIDRFTDLHVLAANTLCHFLDIQESMTQNPRLVDKAIRLITKITARLDTDEERPGTNREALANLYAHLANFYFKRTLHESDEKQQEAYDLSEVAAQRAKELRNDR